MPSFADSAVIFILALILFGPKKLPQLAKQLGKLMAEFRRASNEFRMQMEDELRIEEQKEHEAKVAAMAGPTSTDTEPAALVAPETEAAIEESETPVEQVTAPIAPEPIAQAGELKMMPPSTGLPVESAARGTTAQPAVEEHTILPPDHAAATAESTVGVSSEEPQPESLNA